MSIVVIKDFSSMAIIRLQAALCVQHAHMTRAMCARIEVICTLFAPLSSIKVCTLALGYMLCTYSLDTADR